MPFNGSGSFSPPGADFPAVANTLIESAKFNSIINDIATGLSTCITKNGQTTVTANIPFGGFALTGVGSGLAARTRAANVGDVQDSSPMWGGTAGGTADALTLTLSPAITAYAAGQVFNFKSSSSPNTGATTIAINGLATKAIQYLGAALGAGVIEASKWYSIIYDGAAFQLQKISSVIASGTLTSGRIPLVSTSGLLTDNAAFTWFDGPTGPYLMISDSGTDATDFFVINTGSGAARIYATATGTGSTADASILLTVDGAFGGGGTTTWNISIDNSASNALVIGPSSFVGSSNSISISTSGNVTIPTGDFAVSRASVAGNVLSDVSNTDNTNGASNARARVIAGGASGGDALISFEISGVIGWSIGIDNSDSDTLKIGPNAAVGTSTAISITSGGQTGIGVAASSTSNLTLAAGTTGVSSLRVPHGSAPSAPVDGDIWTTTSGLFVRINGVTVGPLT